MYMFPPQNPDLQPESMWNYEIALSQTLLDGRFRYGVNVFYIDGKNLIVTLPNPNGTGMLNQNSGTIYNSGVQRPLERFHRSAIYCRAVHGRRRQSATGEFCAVEPAGLFPHLQVA